MVKPKQMIDEDLWSKHQYQVLAGFVHYLAYYRVLSKIYGDLSKKSEFWTRTIDAHLLRAIIDWCMVFGADSNEIHWKRVVLDKASQTAFRKHLTTVTGMTGSKWKIYWLSMTKFRNKYASHKSVQGKYPSVPMMDMALQVATGYDDWVRQKVYASFREPSLRDRYQRLIRTSPQSLTKAVRKGPWIEDEYEGHPPIAV